MSKRLGLIGAGKWGTNYIKTVEAMSGVEISIICTRRGFPVDGYKTTINITDVIDEGVDGVIIATPPEDHYLVALKLLESGIPVLLEKPISTKLLECQNLILTARAGNAAFQVNYTHLYSSAFRLLQEEVKSWGDCPIRIVSAGGNAGPYRNYSSLQDYGPHDLAMVIKLLGKPYNCEIVEDAKAHGSVYQINMLFDTGTATSYVGNGFDRKYRNITVKNMRDDRFAIYDDLNNDKLKINGKVVQIDDSTPLTNAVQNFIDSLESGSAWREELEISKHLSLTLNSPITAVQ